MHVPYTCASWLRTTNCNTHVKDAEPKLGPPVVERVRLNMYYLAPHRSIQRTHTLVYCGDKQGDTYRQKNCERRRGSVHESAMTRFFYSERTQEGLVLAGASHACRNISNTNFLLVRGHIERCQHIGSPDQATR